MNRTYWGYHLPGLKETDIDLSKEPTGYDNMIVQPTDNRVIYYIPIDEIQSNTLCVQKSIIQQIKISCSFKLMLIENYKAFCTSCRDNETSLHNYKGKIIRDFLSSK
jgi:hypothetical protein